MEIYFSRRQNLWAKKSRSDPTFDVHEHKHALLYELINS